MTALFSDMFTDLGLSEFFGSGPIPPESVARGVLGIGLYLPLDRAGIKAAFRFQVKILRPDLNDTAADQLRRQDAEADSAARLAELLWARDDLLRRVKDPVTGDKEVMTDAFTRNAARCKGCDGQRRTSNDDPYPIRYNDRRDARWVGYCWPCANDAENERQRDLRRKRRANRPCKGCGRPFTGSRSDAAYCSSACRQRAYRQRGGQP